VHKPYVTVLKITNEEFNILSKYLLYVPYMTGS